MIRGEEIISGSLLTGYFCGYIALMCGVTYILKVGWVGGNI